MNLITVIAIAVAALVAGYFLGFTIGEKQGNQALQAPVVDTGYQNPFEGVKLNPFR